MNQPFPLLASTLLDGDLLDVMYMALYRTAWQDGRPVERMADESPMALARRYEYVGEDSAAIRFHLRSDVFWSDGQPVTADDVVWTYEVMGEPDLPSPRSEFVQHLDSVVAETDSTVTFHYARRYAEMLYHAGHPIVPRHVYAEVPPGEIDTHPSLLNPQELVVDGPFRISAWTRGQQIVLEPNPHFAPRPYLDRIVLRIIPEEATRLVELQTGAVDAMRLSSPSHLATLRQAPQVRLETISRRFVEFVAYNPRLEPFADPEVRRALGLAIDVPAVISALELNGHADPAASVYSPIFRDLQDPQLQPLRFDPEEARRILEARGWRDEDGDGVREKDGQRFSFTLLSNAENQRRTDTGTILQRYWAQVGVEARLARQEFQTFSSRLIARDYEAAMYGWQVPLSPDVSGMWAPEAMLNFVSYREPELDRLLQTALAQETEQEAAPYWKATARLLARDQPYTWLFYMDQVVPIRDRLRGTHVDTYGMYQNVWEWWVAEPR